MDSDKLSLQQDAQQCDNQASEAQALPRMAQSKEVGGTLICLSYFYLVLGTGSYL